MKNILKKSDIVTCDDIKGYYKICRVYNGHAFPENTYVNIIQVLDENYMEPTNPISYSCIHSLCHKYPLPRFSEAISKIQTQLINLTKIIS